MIQAPSIDSKASILADWLELNALFNIQGRGYVDQIINSFDFEADFDNPDIADADMAEEDIRLRIASEIEKRLDDLGDTYPFELLYRGEVLHFTGANTPGQNSYLVSLLAENSWRGGLLTGDGKYSPAELVALRNAFEVIAGLAAAGFSGGPSFLIGTNRAGADALLERIRLLCEHVQEGIARDEPINFAPPNANDDGVDIIAVRMEQDGPPHTCFYFCQSASGQNFRSKPIRNEIQSFLETWFAVPPVNRDAVVIIPAMLDRNELRRESSRLGHILHRARAPRYAEIGASLAQGGQRVVDCWHRRGEIAGLLQSYAARTGAYIA